MMREEQIESLRKYVNLRLYLRQQINKIKQIIELRKLKILCVLKKIVYKLIKGSVDALRHLFPDDNLYLDFRISFYQEAINVLL